MRYIDSSKYSLHDINSHLQNKKNMATKSKIGGGFSSRTATPEFDYEGAIDLADVSYEKVEVGYYWEGRGELPPLPIGFFIPVKEGGGVEHLTTYTFKAEVLKAASSELFLEKSEERARDAKATVQKLSGFLSRSIDTLGGYPLQEIVERFGNSADILFQRAWLGDVFTMYLGARLAVLGDPLAISGIQCNCPRKEAVYDDPENGRPLHSLNEIEIRYMSLDGKMPLFKAELPVGFNDGKNLVKNLYCQPLKLSDLSAIADSKGQDTTKHKTLQRMIVGMPESEIFGLKRGSVFTEEVFKKLAIKDRRAVDEIIKELQPGPINNVTTRCNACLDAPKISYTLPWINQTSVFLYASDEPEIPEE